MPEKTVFLIRHGRTQGNEEKRYTGSRTDEELLPEGIHEAERLRGRLSGLLPGTYRVYSGPLRRTRETAEILFPDTPALVIDRLTEIDFGEFEGKSHRELLGLQAYQAWLDAGGKMPIPGGEPRERFVRRSYLGFLEALGDASREEGAVIVCHGGNIMSIMSTLTGEDYYAFLTKNLGGYIVKLETGDGETSVISYDRLDCGDPD